MLFRFVLLAFCVIHPYLAIASTVALSANSGEFNAKSLGSPAMQGTLPASFRITHFDSSGAWPAAAYVGFFQGPNRNESVQFFIVRNKVSDAHLVAGYRVIEAGKEVKVASVGTLLPTEMAHVTITIDHGLAKIFLPNREPVVLKTKLGDVSPYISVSSGTAEFEIAP
ncbi:hypothetical protein LMG6871_04486 [Ralstonia edaphis]|uniref:hypothetical protein n=1 Tax=Ralstonia edaphi TaxID=3058599 RepID=UPI0028F64D3D|nr:hypothetical protein [Ralstonia sp. LMG 6871]CAJ0721062.1 hypothetical protein LMG6871_04486 [Ralstonia sp. LMG 6871]